MGYISNTIDNVRRFFKGDKERVAYNIAKSNTNSPLSSTNYGMMSSYSYDSLSNYLELENDILGKYADYENMMMMPELSSGIDVYGDDSTAPDLYLKRSVWVTSTDRRIQKILDDLFQKTLRIDEDIWEMARTLCMYGSNFEEILITNDGVQGLNYMPVPTVRRIEGPRGELFGFIQDYRGRYGFNPKDLENLLKVRHGEIDNVSRDPFRYSTENPDSLPTVALEDVEVCHMRLKGGFRKSVYGSSVLEPGRDIWKRLVLLEDAAMIYRLQRAPERFAIYVDVGDIPAGEVVPHLKRIRQEYKKKKYIDPSSNKLNLKMEVLSPDDDFILPIRQGIEGAKVQTLTSPAWQAMDDINYFLDKLYAAIKIPKAFLGQPEGVVRSSLSQIDVRFCRTIMRIQREIINGLEKVCRIHLSALGIDPESVDFEVHMAAPSSVLELGQLEVKNAQAAFSAAMRANVSQYWILSKVFGMSDGEIQGIFKQQEDEMMRTFMIQAQAQLKMQAMMPQPTPGDVNAQMAQQQGEQPQYQMPQQSTQPMFSSYKYPFISNEQDLFEGNRLHEREIEAKFDTILKNNKEVRKTLHGLQGLLQDMKFRKVI